MSKRLIMTVLAVITGTFISATAQIPEAPIEATMQVSNASPFEKETFFLTLTITTRDIAIRQQLDLAGLPDSKRIAIISPFEALPIQRNVDGPGSVEIRRYRARARGMAAGETVIAPVLRLTAQRRTRSFFGSMIEESPVSINIPPVSVRVTPLPPPPEGFCGAVGALSIDVSVSPTNIVVGDLLTVITRISGEGFLDALNIPGIADAPLLKAYPVKEEQQEPLRVRFSQTVIPKSDAVSQIPAIRITYFDTTERTYVTRTAGPFTLNYHAASAKVVEQFRPDQTSSSNEKVNDDGGLAARLKKQLAAEHRVIVSCESETPARLAPSIMSLTTFSIPPKNDIQVIDRHNEWLMIEHNQRRGWIHESELTP